MVLKAMLETRQLKTDREFAVMAALKMSRSEYRGESVGAVLQQVATQNNTAQLARAIHPVLCSLDLLKWMGDDGQCAYIVEARHGRGQEGTKLAFDTQGAEIPVSDTSQLTG